MLRTQCGTYWINLPSFSSSTNLSFTDQVFGVGIDKHCNFTRKKVPQIVLKCLTRIKKSSAPLTPERECYSLVP